MDAFLGEVRILPYTFPPAGWALCSGQLLPISQNQALFAVIGATFGGNWRTTMGVPNFIGAAPMGTGTGPGLTPRQLGESGGIDGVSLTPDNLPSHDHIVQKVYIDVSSDKSPAGKYLGRMNGNLVYKSTSQGISEKVSMAYEALGVAGASYPHENRQPSLAMNYCICLDGLFPARN